ncbi:C-type lectin [Elysia marginata]|uniref:C-type lectin n=1 Tax=Elysia marginata TaxID=1093978 RepID=A0AAV4JXM2_9GAST|nr:C-type lectin [Elysia marginata]
MLGLLMTSVDNLGEASSVIAIGEFVMYTSPSSSSPALRPSGKTLAQRSGEYTFMADSTTLLDSIPFRVADTQWSGITSGSSCANKVVLLCPSSRGYIYVSGSGLCTPLLWLHKGSGQASSSFPAGQLYLTTDHLCPDPFQAVEYGTERQIACVLRMNVSMTYQEATSDCVSRGGYLASVKTSEKLAMVGSLAKGDSMWVGIDDLVEEGRYIWQEDNSQLTSAVRVVVFSSGQPNNHGNKEDCIHYRGGGYIRLNDDKCWNRIDALCETSLLNPQC